MTQVISIQNISYVSKIIFEIINSRKYALNRFWAKKFIFLFLNIQDTKIDKITF